MFFLLFLIMNTDLHTQKFLHRILYTLFGTNKKIKTHTLKEMFQTNPQQPTNPDKKKLFLLFLRILKLLQCKYSYKPR